MQALEERFQHARPLGAVVWSAGSIRPVKLQGLHVDGAIPSRALQDGFTRHHVGACMRAGAKVQVLRMSLGKSATPSKFVVTRKACEARLLSWFHEAYLSIYIHK